MSFSEIPCSYSGFPHVLSEAIGLIVQSACFLQVDLSEEDPHTKLSEADLITKEDSDEEESEGTTDESGQDNMIEGGCSLVLRSSSSNP